MRKATWIIIGGALLTVVLIRLYPEMVMGQLPIGTDTSNTYITSYLTFHESLSTALRSFNFYFYVLALIHRYTHLDALLAIKLASILTFAGMIAVFIWLIVTFIKPRFYVTALSVLLFGLQFSTLRLSWDLLRNETALMFAMISITSFWIARSHSNHHFKRWLIIAFAAGLLTIVVHQMAAILFVLLVIFAGLFYLLHRFTPSVIPHLILVPILVISWLLFSPRISYQGFSLWMDQIDPIRTITPWHLFQTLFPYALLALLVIGLIKRPFWPLLTICLIVAISAFSPSFLNQRVFFLWDRWMYFLGLPLCFYATMALDTIDRVITRLRFSKLTISLVIFFIVAICSLPSWRFIDPNGNVAIMVRENATNSVTNDLDGYVPPNMVWNALGRPSYDQLKIAATVIQNANHQRPRPIYADWRVVGMAHYFIPDLVRKIVFVSAPLEVKQPYYFYCFDYPEMHYDKVLYKGTNDCPIYEAD